MKLDNFCFDGRNTYNHKKFESDCTDGVASKKEGQALLDQNKQRLDALQDRFAADGSTGLVVLFQALDAGGKDGTIRHVFGGLNPQGIEVSSFKSPSGEELQHDYLWRVARRLPQRGTIGVFNRSHYEDVLIARVLDLPGQQNLPGRVTRPGLWQRRYKQIVNFEDYLYENGYVVLKFFLNVSKEEQRERFLERLDQPEKNWKFSLGDLDTRDKWDDYQKAYEECINSTATRHSPWYVIPADKKWYARCAVSEVVLQTLERIDPHYPRITDEAEIQQGRLRLQAEQE